MNYWERLLQAMGREGADDWMLGIFYVVVVQAVLLYG